MRFDAKIKDLDPHIEQLVALEVNGITLICFDQFGYPGDLSVGCKYLVNIEVAIFNEECFRQIDVLKASMERINDSFAYYIRGKFNHGARKIDSDICIELSEEAIDLHDYTYLDGKYVELRVDRFVLKYL